MMVKHEYIDFRINRRTLWVGMEAYNLSMVTRVRPIEIVPNRRRMIVRYVRRSGATIGLGVFAALVLSYAGDQVPTLATTVCVLAFLGALVWHTVTLVRGLGRPTLYVLSVVTAGAARAALASTNRDMIYDLTRRVADAIDNDHADFYMQVENVIHGDQVFGPKVDGDWVSRDKIVEG